jgi:hypothetical protein
MKRYLDLSNDSEKYILSMHKALYSIELLSSIDLSAFEQNNDAESVWKNILPQEVKS